MSNIEEHTAMEIIRTVDVERTYEDKGVPVHAVNGVNLIVEQGEFSVLAGASGSGKTTLLNVIGALDVPTRGEVFLHGEALSQKAGNELSAIRLTKIGFVFQAYNLIPVLSALENVSFPMVLQGVAASERRERAMAILDELDLAGLAHKRPGAMSGGQQQRVAVARAIVTNPALVLADEPTANLDSVTGHKLLDMMLRLNEEKKITFVFASHDEKVIARAKRLVTMRDGQIINDELRDGVFT